MTDSRITDYAVPPLVGQLPLQCRRDLNELRRLVHATITQETPADPVATSDFREVLLTGAAGFVGRFFIRELLQQSDTLVVHCLVRADSAVQGFERICDALKNAEIWEESFAQRMRVVVGDITKERFGLTDCEFDGLCQRIDAVYHLAANVGLVLSYDDIRETNVLGLRPVLHLCLRTRLKHLFYGSTMAVFPAYICEFAREYGQSRIKDQMQPDLAQMKRMFPLGFMGYSWSKLVTEQAVLFAKAAGLPAAIFRLPQMGLSSTGYTQADNFPSRLFAAATQLEKVPRGFSIQRSPESVDTVSEICVAISLNTDRRYTIYHCCDPEPPHDDVELADFGFFWQIVSYESFRRSCQAIGKRSPLHGQWVLLDHYASYWFEESGPGRTRPISDRAIREDCPRAFKWPELLIKHARSYGWIRRHREEWPYSVPQGRLDFNGLMAQAKRYAERMAISFSKTYPAWLQAGLKQLVEALTSSESLMLESRFVYVNYGLTRSLRNNAALALERQNHPEIEQVEIKRPVFIVGINRTGTTFMHRLLARDSNFWALRRFESLEPVLRNGAYGTVAGTVDDPRRSYAEELMRATNFADTLAGLHRVDVDEPEEDFMLLWLAFTSWTHTVAYHVPDYGRWLAANGSRNAYAYHQRVMQHFTWQRRQRETHGQQFWLLKMPFHLMELGALLEAYPDALFIQTHRDPVAFMGSWNSMVERVRSFTTEPRPPHETGAEQLTLMSHMLNSAMKFRQSHSMLDHRWVDVRYTDLVDDPIAVVREIYARFDWRLSPEAEGAMQDWLVRQEEERRHEPRHKYRLGDYGIAPEAVNDAFLPYLEFVSARGIM